MKYCLLTVAAICTSSFLACGSGGAKFSSLTTSPPITNNEWTWLGGANIVNQPGTYGSQGTGSPSNIPSARALAVGWTDKAGAFWLFGGSQSSMAQTYLNDLWKYSSGQWTWVGGSATPNQPAGYGTLGVPAAGNVPGGRNGGASWTDQSGNLWLFGGLGLDSNGMSEYLNDLWEYSAGQWIWIGGSSVGGHSGVYGMQGVSASSNIPGARQPAASWIDSAGNFWLFGGVGYDSNGKPDYLNDLWEYSGGQWTWISGSNVVDQAGSYGTQGTAAPGNVPGSRLEAMSWSDASGTFWLFGGSPGPDGQFGLFSDLWTFNAGEWTWTGGSNQLDQVGIYGSQGTAAAANNPGARVSSVTWTDTSGNLWLFGGDGYDSAGGVGQLNDLWKYSGGEWTWMGGAQIAGQAGTYGTLGSAASSNIPGARTWAARWVDPSGNFWFFGGQGYDSAGTLGYLNDFWKYQP
jgi:hypothetical protein